MSAANWLQFALLAALVAVTAPPLGRYMAHVYGNEKTRGERVFSAVERPIYRLCRVDPTQEQRWTTYAIAVIGFSLVSLLVLYAQLRLQGVLPFNPTNMPAVGQHLAFNTAVSF